MTVCEFFNQCALFQNGTDSELKEAIKLNYCEKRKVFCARYLVATKAGKDYVSETLMPFMNDKAWSIISERQ